jgi:glycosyltransferase involved in cell wall biosynthesis
MPTISLAMICHNEGATLEKAIQSALPFVDEVVIGVDKSSTDNTAEIAKMYATPGKYFEYEWRDDFSWARNQAIKRCEMSLVCVVDGHEFIPGDDEPIGVNCARMRGTDPNTVQVPTPMALFDNIHKEGLPEGMDVACITLAMNVDEWGIPQLFFLQPRIFRNTGEIYYQNPVHNALMGYDQEKAMAYPEAIIVHNMPPQREAKRKKQRGKMNFSGLMADVREERKKPIEDQNARPFFYMGNSHADLGNQKQAIHWYEQYLKRSKFGEERYQALQQLAVLEHRYHKDPIKAREYARQASETQWRRCEPHVLMGEICAQEGDWEQAIHHFDVCDIYEAPLTVMFLQGSVYSYMPDFQRARCYANLNNWGKALEYIERVLTWRPGDPEALALYGEFKSHLNHSEGQPNLLMVDRVGSFTTDIGQTFTDNGFCVSRQNACDNQWKAWADLAWFEWCDENIAHWSRADWDCPVIVRLHSYEAFGNMPEAVNWQNISHLIFVAPHIQQLVHQRWPELAKVPQSVIPNGVKLNGLEYKERSHGKRIGYLGYLNHKKGIDLLIQAMYSFPEYEFHVAGSFQDPHLEYYALNSWAEMSNVWFHGWIDNKDEWLEEVDYLISPSIVESFGYSIAEAMVKGIKPLVHHRPGAIWPQTWRTMDDLELMIDPHSEYNSQAYRDHIVNNYSLEKQMSMTMDLVQSLLAHKQQRGPHLEFAQEVVCPKIDI